MYRTVSNEMPKTLRSYDMIILFTPSGVESLQKHYPNLKQGKLRIGCWGQATAKALVEAGLRLDLEAPSVEAPSMTGSLDLYLERENKAEKAAAKKATATKKKTATSAKKSTATKKATSTKATSTTKKATATTKKAASATKKATTTAAKKKTTATKKEA